MKDCKACEGEGLIVVGWDDEAYENIEADCPDCGGTGKISSKVKSYIPLHQISFDGGEHFNTVFGEPEGDE